MCVCICVPFKAVHLPLCADMGSFSAAKQCSFYSLPLSVSPLCHSCSLALSLFLFSNTALCLSAPPFRYTCLLGEAALSSPVLSPLPSLSGAFSSSPSIFLESLTYSSCIFLLICAPAGVSHRLPFASLSLCHCLCLFKVGQT